MSGIASPLSQLDLTPVLAILSLVLFSAFGILLYFFIGKSEETKELKHSFDKIMSSFNELDEQAKLIVKTDLELNKAQEELDRRLSGLNSLQKLARRMSMTLDENEIFQRIDKTLMDELGFSRAFVAAMSEEGSLVPRVVINFDPKTAGTVGPELEKDADFLNALKDGITFSSLNASLKKKAFIAKAFDCEHFVLTPLLTQRGVAGILFFGNRYNAPPVTQGDEEIIAILANQLAQSLENTQLFEQVYRSSQMLETKVSERTRELSLALKAVEEVSKKKSEFISAVSHELRTPLTSIKGYASILITGKVGEIPDAVKERLAKINLHSDNLVKLINDLLDISRIESGRVEMKTSLLPIKPMLDNIVDLLTPQLKEKSITIRSRVAPDMPPVEFDQSQVERVFINLISNAIKFTPPGGTITVNGLVNRDKQEVSFEVADTGIGIKKEDLGKIFDEFYRVDNQINLSVKGTGLGLSLAKNIVEAHYGKIWVTSEVGTGTSFHFTLPLEHISSQKKNNSPIEE
jgi:signal transduction histidine kinase